MRIVVALGGNALLRRGEPAEAANQRANVRAAARSLAELAGEHELIVTHGNGPQVGLLALQAAAYQDVAPYPLDVLGAETEGMIGYLLDQELRNALPGREVATLLSQVVVDARDPGFAHPTKPVGPIYSADDAAALAATSEWTFAPDGEHMRRVVPSPEPLDIVELEPVRALLDAGVMVICAGGGGIPVLRDPDGSLSGVEAVVDKDLVAALLAERLRADALLLLTDVEQVVLGWGTPDATPLGSTSPSQLRGHDFAAGSMGPKVEAACRFVEVTGGRAAIGALTDARRLAAGESGTQVEAVASLA